MDAREDRRSPRPELDKAGVLVALALAVLGGCVANIAGEDPGSDNPTPGGSGGRSVSGSGSASGTGSVSGGGTGATSGTGTGSGGGAIVGGSGGSGGSTGMGGTTIALPPFAPAPGAYRRLTNTAFRNSLRDLLGGAVDVGALEADSWSTGGLPTIGGATVTISPLGAEQYQTAIENATAQAFADMARRNQILGCTPRSATDTACFQSFVTTFGRRALRRPLTTAQVTRFTQLISTAATNLGDPVEAMRAGLIAMLGSPNFLYRLERGSAPSGGSSFWQYTSSEMASRLSYFLTNSTPDAMLLDAADQNALSTAQGVRTHAERLLMTPAGRQSIGNFAAELFQVQKLATRPKDPDMYKEYTDALKTGIIQEIPAMFQALAFDRNASVLEIFTTRNTVVTRELAAVYGIPTTGISATAPTAVTLPADGLRAGLLGTSAFLALNASQQEGSPTFRGKFIREMLLCQPVPAPPPDVDTMFKDPPAGTIRTKREKLADHLSVASCAVCHTFIDPPGLALENFDAIGKYRTTDQGKAIDVSGDLDGVKFNGPIELGQALSKRTDAAACMLRHLYRYATGHVDVPSEAMVISQLTSRFEAGGYKLRDLVLDIATSDGFRFVAPPAP